MRNGFQTWFAWHFVWTIPLLVTGLLLAPVNLGYLPKSPTILTLAAAFAGALLMASGRIGMQLVLRHRAARRAWVIPEVVNAEVVVLSVIGSRSVFPSFVLYMLAGVALVNLGMWLSIRQHRTASEAVGSDQVAPLT